MQMQILMAKSFLKNSDSQKGILKGILTHLERQKEIQKRKDFLMR